MASIAWFKRMVSIFGNTVANGTVTADKLAAGSVSAAKLASNAVETAKMKDANVTAAKLASNAVETAKIADANVTADKLAANAVTTAKIADGAVTSAKLADVLGTAAIADGAVTDAKVNEGANIAVGKLAVPTGKLVVGNATNNGEAQTVSGDISLSAGGVAAIAAGVVNNADVAANAAIAFSKLAALADGNLLIGSAGNVATSTAMQGDATLANDGTLTIAAEAVDAAKIADDADIALTQLAAVNPGEIIVGTAVTGILTAVAMSGDVTISDAGATTIADEAIDAGKIADDAAIAVTQLEGLADGAILVGVDGTGANNALVVMSGDVTMTNAGLTTVNAALKEQIIQVDVVDLAVGDDIAVLPLFVQPRANTLQGIGILTLGAPAGVDDENTVVITIKDDAGNTVVAKTYNTGTQPPTSDYGDLGALNGTHKVLTAGEHLTLSVDQGATADMPAFRIVIVTVPTNAA